MTEGNLTRDEARERARLISDAEYDVHLDLGRDELFGAETVIRFDLAEAGASTFLECTDARVEEITVNGTGVDPSAHDGARITLGDLETENEVRIVTVGSYSTTGRGVNRFHDPMDDRVYVHTDSEPFEAHRVYPCFDQPDVKARFRFSATVPDGWEVVSNARAAGDPEKTGEVVRWQFEQTPRIPPYITVLTAGPFHVVRDRHGDIDLGLYCRRSLAEHLDPDEWLEVTKQGFDFFHQAFGYPYPFDKYDQVVVPEFAAGAMENPGCVTFHERYIFRSRVTGTERELRASTILHEMAHMWFGDLVTMRWWDDLWLNESFASYMGVLSEVEGTRFKEGWTIFANYEKTWALQQDQLPTTHPIVSDIADVQSVHLNFDGITYAKGAAVLKQLVAWVGLDRFLEGMKIYFARHEYGNAELSDFLDALEEVSGRDLRSWSGEWLETPGVNTLSPRFEERDGTFERFEVKQHAPAEQPTLRSHRIAVGLYDDRDGKLIRTQRVELDLVGEATEVGDLQGVRVPALTLLNDDDLSFAKIRFDPLSLKTLRERLSDVEDSLARSVCWTALWDMTRDGELPAREFLDLALRHAPAEREVGALERVLAQAQMAVKLYGDPSARGAGGERLARAAMDQGGRASAGGDHQLAWIRTFVSVATTDEHLEMVRGLLDGSLEIEGVAVDTELRWHIVQSLAASGATDSEALVQAERGRDPTDLGARHAAAALAARPTEAAKSEAWDRVTEDRSLTLAMTDAIMRGFQQPEQESLLQPYAARYMEELDGIWDERGLDFSLDFGEGLFPRWMVGEDTVELVDRGLARDDLPGPLRRLLLEGKDRLLRALRARRVDEQSARR
ncbi:MAG: aminopeptidase N [Actinomycetota bacterium]